MPAPLGFKQDKKSEKHASKPKFIDVYSKFTPKELHTQRRNFKITQSKPLQTEKHLKT
jgi:hypothetical protein